MAGEPRISLEQGERQAIIRLSGSWVIDHAGNSEETVDGTLDAVKNVQRVVVRGEGIDALDTVGAWQLNGMYTALAERGIEVEQDGFRAAHSRFIARIAKVSASGEPAEPRRRNGILKRLEGLGRTCVGGLRHAGESAEFLAGVFMTTLRILVHPRRFRFGAVVANMYRAGVTAIPIVGLMAFLISIVLSYQGVVQLERFGAEIYTINLTVVSLLREMGVLLTAVVVAGRSGSAFAAELGVMRLNGEIDAMETLGMSPTEVLVLPRILALMIMVPLLTFLADLFGLVGTAFSARMLVELSLPQFLHQARSALTPDSFWMGMIKAPVFAFMIATTATFWGIKEAESPEEVGQQVTISVVQSIFLVIVADAVVSVALSRAGI
ncbi:MlaE family ABC transporter permease [Thiohalorhabdus sp. Cl-TMA]|uniref:MlaE family ABC transporter permease n=1 Tax=Thiohalorhabdus methylotrophus TaxID=3242694 RepID=A0ABV4TR15_9GAMM